MTWRNFLKIALLWTLCFLFRLFPFRVPNVEPILAAQMPLSRQSGAVSGFLFGFLSIFFFDVFTMRVGWWTLITALMYGFLGLLASRYLHSRSSRASYVTFAVVGTLLYDAVTGLTVGPLFFGQSLLLAALGQIPFTLAHLLGNVVFALTLSPLIGGWLGERRGSDIPNAIPQGLFVEVKNVYNKYV